MNILHRRPLFLCCAVFLVASVVGLALPATGKLIVGLLSLACAILYAIFSLRRRCSRGRIILVAVATLLASVGLLLSHLTFSGSQTIRLQELEQTTVWVKGTVTDRRGSGGNLTSYALALASVNGESTDGMAVLTCYYVSGLQPGYEVELEATLIPLSEAAGDGYDATALQGDGYVIGLLSEDETTVTVLQEESKKLSVRAGNLRRMLSARLDLLAGKDAKGLPSALLFGEKSYLSDEVRRDFSRAGISHLLAISGLHVTLLFGLLDGLLRLLRVSKKFRAVLLASGAVGYLILLGFPPAATRATIMLGVTYLSYLLSSRADPLTSLGLSGALIVAVTPYAVADAGFWMSFLATLGLVTVMPLVWEWLNRTPRREASPLWTMLRRDLIKCMVALAVGLIAMSFTLSMVAAVIGEMGILSAVTTILLTPFCAVILLLSLLVLPFIGTAVGAFLGSSVQLVCIYMLNLVEWIANPSWVVISLRHPAVLPLAALMLVAVLAFLVIQLPTRRRWLTVLPILLGWTAIGGVLGIHHILNRDEIDVTYLQPSSVSDSIVMVSGQDGFICDLSNGSLSSMTTAVREAERRGATELSALMLTHYHNRTSGALSTLLSREMVRALWLPSPDNEEDYGYMLSCLEKAKLANVPVFVYDAGETLEVFGEGRLTLETASIKRSEQPVLLVSLDVSLEETGSDRLVYCGSAVFESELAERAAELVEAADTVIFGNHGPLCKKPYGATTDMTDSQQIIFSAYGDIAAWFDSEGLPNHILLWMGQKRFVLYR